MITAPTTDAMKPAGSPSLYQPTARPIRPAISDPPIPSRIVTMTPPGSCPGMMSLANAPTIKPTTIIHSKYMLKPPFSSNGCGYSRDRVQITCQKGRRKRRAAWPDDRRGEGAGHARALDWLPDSFHRRDD